MFNFDYVKNEGIKEHNPKWPFLNFPNVISSATGETKFKITDTKCYVSIVTLSTQDNAKLLQQLKWALKRTINWYKSQTKVSAEWVNQYLDFLIVSGFQGVNWRFVSFENKGDRKVHTGYYLPKVEIKDYNITIDGKIFFWSAG